MSTAAPGSMEGAHSRGGQGDRQNMFWDYRRPGEGGSEEDKSPKGPVPVQLEFPALTVNPKPQMARRQKQLLHQPSRAGLSLCRLSLSAVVGHPV